MASIFTSGLKLSFKKERSADEECAASSFKRTLLATLLASLVIAGGAVAAGGALPNLNPSYTGEYDHAHVAMASGDYGLFSDGDIYSIDLGDYALDDLKEGASLTVYVDEYEQVVGADSSSDPDYLLYLAATAGTVVGIALVTFLYCALLLPALAHDFLHWWGEQDDEGDVPEIPRGEDVTGGNFEAIGIVEPIEMVPVEVPVEQRVDEEPKAATETEFVRDEIGHISSDTTLEETQLYPRL